nr:hypothetical protein Iba_chr04cCG11020 [Ipomoea batatas]
MKGAVLSDTSVFGARGISDATLMSFICGKACQPTSLSEAGDALLAELRLAEDSAGPTETDTGKSEELWTLIVNFISQKAAAKLCVIVRGPFSSHHIGLVLITLQNTRELNYFFG